MAVKKAEHRPWHPAPWTAPEAWAIKALASGVANERQQKLALDWIIRAAGTYDLSYQPENERDTAFAEGKRWLGLQLVKLVNLPSNLIKGNPHE